MKKLRGILKRVGAKEGDMIVNTRTNSSVGNVRVSGKVSVIEIGDTVLRDVGCTRDIYDLLDVGKDAILYVHFNNFKKPTILGVAYPQDGRGFMVPMMAIIANTIMSLFLYPIVSIILGLIVAGISGVLGLLVGLGGIGFTVYGVVNLIKGYLHASAAVRSLRPA
ncbi:MULTISPECIES: hypothetical protein [unclassified Novosphingobium]|uniref:hypothetical protein n=1 Tax=unclassified Novosphingobium TaxID=2644732 RepID=UPI0014484D72|nr:MULTISPECIES: hypothetical protein [unclassified Novosphingobium]NKJ45102.1 hypothetical protein [Novosphingobium sp. SG720]NMN06804.1 hypothetical protein [Novosphingobium sp. SG919]NMN88745.1 hypothetical protein [Novosphingobium sp. SG916]